MKNYGWVVGGCFSQRKMVLGSWRDMIKIWKTFHDIARLEIQI